MKVNDRKKLLKSFLKEWPISRIKKMTLEEYSKPGERNSFCYDIEFKTNELANISGSPSTKFEIFKRKHPANHPKSIDYGFDEEYTWRNRNKTIKSREEAWDYTKHTIIKIVQFASKGDFRSIDGLKFAPLVKWKIAFLYSNYKIVSISDRAALRFIAEIEGMENYKNARVSDLHRYIMTKVNRNNYWSTMSEFWDLFKAEKLFRKWNSNTNKTSETLQQHLEDVKESIFVRSAQEVIVRKRHKILQNILLEDLKEEYGNGSVHLEKEGVDIVVKTEKGFKLYEVKISHSAKNCIREALGQIIEYSHYTSFNNILELIIVGNHPMMDEDKEYFKYLNSCISLNLQYIYKKLN
jgi:hypothetical protein